MQLIMFGPPGAGKGTQSKLLSAQFNIPQISTGDLLRNAVIQGTGIGKKAKAILDAGQLVSDDIMIGIIRDVVKSDKCINGFILDGFPRTLTQAKGLSLLCNELKMKIDYVVSLELDEKEIIKRLGNRVSCNKCERIYNLTIDDVGNGTQCPYCSGQLYQRDDDEPETVHKRLIVYVRSTAPVREYYRKLGLLKSINAMKSVEQVNREILASINPS